MSNELIDEIVAGIDAVIERVGLWHTGPERMLEGGQDNLNLLVETNEGPVVLRRYTYTTPTDIPYEIEAVEFLARRGFPVPRVFRADDGEAIFDLAGRPVAVFSFVEGDHPDEDDASSIERAGRWLARLHNEIEGFTPEAACLYSEFVEVDRCNGESPLARYRDLVDAVDAFRPEADRLREAAAELPSGVIHADFSAENLLCDGDRLTAVLDFDTSYVGTFVRDLAEAILIWGYDGRSLELDPARVAPLVAGYEAVRGLGDAERHVLATSVQLACFSDAVRFLVWKIDIEEAPDSASECLMFERFLALRERGVPLPTR